MAEKTTHSEREVSTDNNDNRNIVRVSNADFQNTDITHLEDWCNTYISTFVTIYAKFTKSFLTITIGKQRRAWSEPRWMTAREYQVL